MTALPYILPRTLPGDLPGDLDGDGNAADDTGGRADGTLAEIDALCTQSLGLLIGQYAESARLRDLLCAYIERLQEFETGAVGVYERVLDVDNAEGVHLDLLGRIVRENRNGLSDYVYRRMIKTRVLVNRSQGRIRDLIQIARTLEDLDLVTADPAAYVRIREDQPARIEVRVINTPANLPDLVHERMKAAKAAGVSLTTMTIPYPATTLRGFTLIRASAYPEKNTTTGLCPASNRTAGGYLLHAMTG